MRKFYRTLSTVIVGVALTGGGAALSGCANDAQTGALIGSGVGAAAGAGIDHDNRGRGALIGAGVGAIGGYIFGNESDKAKAREYEQY